MAAGASRDARDSLSQFAHGRVETFDRQRIHASGEKLAHQPDRGGSLPLGLRHWIEPYAGGISGDDALDPDSPGLFVEVLDRAAWSHDLIRLLQDCSRKPRTAK